MKAEFEFRIVERRGTFEDWEKPFRVDIRGWDTESGAELVAGWKPDSWHRTIEEAEAEVARWCEVVRGRFLRHDTVLSIHHQDGSVDYLAEPQRKTDLRPWWKRLFARGGEADE